MKQHSTYRLSFKQFLRFDSPESARKRRSNSFAYWLFHAITLERKGFFDIPHFERKVRFYGEHTNVHQSHSQNDSGELRGVARGDGELGCLCGKAGTSHLCDGFAHSSGCVVNGSNVIKG